MHPAFDVLDILLEIFAQFDPERSCYHEAVVANTVEPWRPCPERRESRLTLFRLALVCRAFTTPALDVLWRSPGRIDSVGWILYANSVSTATGITPSSFYTHSVPTTTGMAPSRYSRGIKRPLMSMESLVITSEGWMRIYGYLRRIRFLTLALRDLHSIPERLLNSYFVHVDTTCLLPSLEQVSLIFGNDQPLPPSYPLHLIFPPLRILKTSLACDRHQGEHSAHAKNEAVFRYLAGIASNVQDINLYVTQRYPRTSAIPYMPSLSLVVGPDPMRLQNLSIRSCCILPSDLFALALLPSLSNLSVTVRNVSSLLASNNSANTFPALQHLELRGDISDVLLFIEMVSSPHLRQLFIEAHFEHAASQCYTMLARLCGSLKEPLRVLVIDIESLMEGPPEESIVFKEHFGSVLASLKLEKLSLRSFRARRWRLSDDDMKELATAWPDLDFLRIATTGRGLTLKSLQHCARLCPRLRELSVGSMEIGDLMKEGDDPDLYGHSLRRLQTTAMHISDSTRPAVEQEEWTARFLDSLFPYLNISDEIRVSRQWRPEGPDVWVSILKRLAGLQEQRNGHQTVRRTHEEWQNMP
ncbi:hypothetical protein CERSUDRAFT_68691 [Gelatoporia subvermispora B]|uniref:F-box domain-containing protein n=1 Tax=Ceriporiopsis subvermispora (strain B) TaxID=914234 RepID=M2R0F4_CERS8|nr:hypothetical protein CERSUDRAFT_68691 [Gelatoporia subvermispora B]